MYAKYKTSVQNRIIQEVSKLHCIAIIVNKLKDNEKKKWI